MVSTIPSYGWSTIVFTTWKLIHFEWSRDLEELESMTARGSACDMGRVSKRSVIPGGARKKPRESLRFLWVILDFVGLYGDIMGYQPTIGDSGVWGWPHANDHFAQEDDAKT